MDMLNQLAKEGVSGHAVASNCLDSRWVDARSFSRPSATPGELLGQVWDDDLLD